ncbi:MAG: hypothetical protein PHI90_04765 [Clostridia bacterium]|nr:hypothetical protein [Clostridia bacterium]MDD4048125.1 hypothetical protein [Clostridia bacterium]
MQKKNVRYVLLLFGFCLCMSLLLPGVAVAEVSTAEAIIGGNNYIGVVEEVVLYGDILLEEEILEKYENMMFVNELEITDEVGNNKISCILNGLFLIELEFNLMKEVDTLEIGLDIPQNLVINEIAGVYKDTVKLDPFDVTVNAENKIFINQSLGMGNYKIQLLIYNNSSFSIKTDYFSYDGDVINYESYPFEVTVVEMPGLL